MELIDIRGAQLFLMRKLPQVKVKGTHLRDNAGHISVNLRPFQAPPSLAMIQLHPKKKGPNLNSAPENEADPKHKFPT